MAKEHHRGWDRAASASRVSRHGGEMGAQHVVHAGTLVSRKVSFQRCRLNAIPKVTKPTIKSTSARITTAISRQTARS